MELLPIHIPPTLRINWVSDTLRAEWEPRLQLAAQTVAAMEVATVQVGLRDATTVHVRPEDLPAKQAEWMHDGLVFLPLRQVRRYAGFAHGHPPVVSGQPWDYYGVLARTLEAAVTWQQAEHGGRMDHAAVGQLLDYPPCCIKAFNERWARGMFDTIWEQSAAGRAVTETVRQVTGSAALSMMLRYAGVRAVPHLPCSWTCKRSKAQAARWGALAATRGMAEGWAAILDWLKLPASWEAYKGIAIVRTPVMRLIVNSLPCYPAYEVQWLGEGPPAVRTRGLRFPYVGNEPEWLTAMRAGGTVPLTAAG